MKNWLRVVLPPSPYLLLAVVGTLIGTLLPILMNRLATGNPVRFPLNDSPGLAAIYLATLAQGFYRGCYFSPVFSFRYRNWLMRTPWRIGLPLPLGPLHLVWQDLVLVVLLTALSALHEEFRLLAIGATFFTAYLVAIGGGLLLTGKLKHAYLIAFLFGLSALCSELPIGFILCYVAMYWIAFEGMKQSLRNFHEWDLSSYDESPLLQTDLGRMQDVQRIHMHGWPFNRLSPPRKIFSLQFSTAFAIAVLLGWWSFVILSTVELNHNRELFAMSAGVSLTLVASVTRLFAYLWGYSPPLNLWGRIVRFRWLIPGYDKVFLAVILAMSWSGTWSYAVIHWELSSIVALPLQIFGAAMIVLTCPPTLPSWRLTGNHRIVPGLMFQMGEHIETQ